MKSNIVVNYILGMSGIDRSDQMLSCITKVSIKKLAFIS